MMKILNHECHDILCKFRVDEFLPFPVFAYLLRKKSSMEMIVKRILILSLLLLASYLCADTLSSWALTSGGSATPADHITAGVFTPGAGIGAITYGSTGAYANGWSTATLDLTDYFEVTIAPANGYTLDITDVTFSERRSSTGIRSYQVRSSMDGFTTFNTLSTVDVPDDTNIRAGNLTGLTIHVNSGQTLSIRWYGYAAEANTGTWRITNDTLAILGTVTQNTGGEVYTNFSGSPTAGSTPLIVTFSNLTTGGTPPITYDWNFGDGTAHSTATSPQHTYNAAGTYTVTLIATDSAEQTDTETKTGYITATTSDDTYYAPVAGLTGQDLFSGLHNLIDSNTNTSYDASRLFMYGTLDNVNNTVRCVYTGFDFAVPAGEMPTSSSINCEHTYAQSWFGTSQESLKKADVFHLYPVTATVNSSRGNLPFDIVVNQTTDYDSYNGYVSKRGTNANGNTVFEPADQHKGDCARSLMYFAVRYNMGLSQGGVDMLPTLLTWNQSDPVSDKEINRNEDTYEYQGNRNPFIDHPEYASYIWGGTPLYTTLTFSPGSVEVSESAGTITLHVSIVNPSSTVATTATLILSDGNSADVNGFTPVNLTFPAGSSTEQTVTITVTDDALLEGTETMVFTLTNLAGGNSAVDGVTPYFTLTIDDNDIPVPTAFIATSVSTTGFTANWSTETGATGYELDVASDSLFTSYVTGYQAMLTTATAEIISGLIPRHTYYYRVRTVVNEAIGANSNARSVTTLSNAGGSASDLIISEYVEGSSNNKAIELYNGTGADVDLSTYSLKKQTNGAGDFVNEYLLTGTLADGAVLVLAHSSADATILAVADITMNSGIISFNGNDAIALYHTGTLIDMVGVQNDTALWGAEVTLVRKSSVTAPNPTYTTDEWDSYPQNTFTYLGSHTMDNPNPITPVNLTITISGSNVVLSWTAGSRTAGYKIYRSETPYASDWGTAIGTTTDTTWTDTTVGTSTRYYYRVTATN
jgi:PKD repeat protein